MNNILIIGTYTGLALLSFGIVHVIQNQTSGLSIMVLGIGIMAAASNIDKIVRREE